jgi:hypothetical protein
MTSSQFDKIATGVNHQLNLNPMHSSYMPTYESYGHHSLLSGHFSHGSGDVSESIMRRDNEIER